ncbi:F-box domain-containing protein [Balamuthia mandrillaris]
MEEITRNVLNETTTSLLFWLPPELLLNVLTCPVLNACDLVAVELTCFAFGGKKTSTLTLPEQAAKTKLLSSGVGIKQQPNWKKLLHYLLENPPLPTFTCGRCKWCVGGFRCQGHRPPHTVRHWEPITSFPDEEGEPEQEPPVPEPTGCGCYLVWDANSKQLFCPLGCGSVGAPACCCKAYERDPEKRKQLEIEATHLELMIYSPPSAPTTLYTALEKLHSPSQQPKEDGEAKEEEIDSYWDQLPPIRKKTPALTCTRCGFTVADYVCLGQDGNSSHQPNSRPRWLLQLGFYERVWCCYRFGCFHNCSVFRSGAEQPDDDFVHKDRALLCCLSTAECCGGTGSNAHNENTSEAEAEAEARAGTEMATLEWLDHLGPATNYYPYRCTKKTEE